MRLIFMRLLAFILIFMSSPVFTGYKQCYACAYAMLVHSLDISTIMLPFICAYASLIPMSLVKTQA